MLTESRLDELIIYVHDLAESTQFYQGPLALPILASDDDSTRLDAGGITLRLRRARDDNVKLFGRRDDSSDVVFLTEDLEATRAELERRGVQFVRRRSYEVGFVTDFYDPNGHRLMLYQASDIALSWPSAPKIKEIWNHWGRPGQGHALAGKPLVYLFMFENDQTKAFEFYHDKLELTMLERVHCCNQNCAMEIEGVAKYDGGGVVLATHHVHPASIVVDDLGRPYSPTEFNPDHGQGIAPVFEVNEIAPLVSELEGRGVAVSHGVERHADGWFARFTDPFGHPFFIEAR
jgi:catechol 2,3-dioxygenase-like lactoylglutathione lyase family enzyme